MALSAKLAAEFTELCSHYPQKRAGLIPALHRCQEEHGGWLPPEVLEDLAAWFGLEPVEVYGVASFYPMFHLEPVGEHVISVCHNIACALRGAEGVLRQVCALTGARAGLSGTSSDGRWTVKRVECQGACANAPMLEVGGVYHEDLDEEAVAAVIAAPNRRERTGNVSAQVEVPWKTYLLDRTRLADSHRIEVYERHGGYRALKTVLAKEKRWSPADVTAVVKDSALRGRGGAGFPTGLKWTFMPDPAKDPRNRYLAVNADESEPGTCKDRVLMERDPHGLVEGCVLAAYAMRVKAVYIYVRGEYRLSYDRVQAAIDEAREAGYVGKNILGSGFDLEIWMHKGAGAYICGEETGLMESLEGKRGHPRPKPPFPAGSGLWASPTTVNNVETIFNVPFIVDRGAEWFRSMGTEKSSGNFLCGISGHVQRPGVYELPFGLPARQILERMAGGVWRGRKLKAWFPGGSSSGLLPAERIDTPMDHDSVKNAGSMFGTGAMIVLDDTVALAEAERVIARFYEHESCGQCSQCREGTQWLDQILQRIATGKGKAEDPALLESLARGMAPGKTICALSDAAAIPTLALLKSFRPEIERQALTGQPPAGTSPLSEMPHGLPQSAREVQA